MTVSPGGVANLGTHWVSVAGFAVDLAFRVTVDGVIPGKKNGLIGGDEDQDEATKLAGQLQGRPVGRGEDSLVSGALPSSQRGSSAEDVGDSVSPGGPDGRAE